MAARTEQELIDDGFESQFEAVYEVFAESYSEAAGDHTLQKEALDHFQAGIKVARSVRDAAKMNIP